MGCLEDLEKERARLNAPQVEDAFVVVNRRNAMKRQKDMADEIACLAEGIKEVYQWMVKKGELREWLDEKGVIGGDWYEVMENGSMLKSG